MSADPVKEPIAGDIRNEQEIGYSAVEVMLSTIERNVMTLPHHPKFLTILSNWLASTSLAPG